MPITNAVFAVPGGLAYFEDGDGGAGTFWVVERNGSALEYDRNGQLQRSVATGLGEIYGAGYDPTLGRLFLFSRQTNSDPRNVRVFGASFDVANGTLDGTAFYGDLGVIAQSPGGRAEALHAYRRSDGRLRLLCLVDATNDTLYELEGRFEYGFSCSGTIGMQGVPWLGNSNWRISVDGVHGATTAVLKVGFSRSTFAGLPLPIELDPLGFSRCAIVSSWDADVGATGVGGNGASVAFPIPNQPSFSYVPIYLQWLMLDPTRPGGIASSPGGATIVY